MTKVLPRPSVPWHKHSFFFFKKKEILFIFVQNYQCPFQFPCDGDFMYSDWGNGTVVVNNAFVMQCVVAVNEG